MLPNRTVSSLAISPNSNPSSDHSSPVPSPRWTSHVGLQSRKSETIQPINQSQDGLPASIQDYTVEAERWYSDAADRCALEAIRYEQEQKRFTQCGGVSRQQRASKVSPTFGVCPTEQNPSCKATHYRTWEHYYRVKSVNIREHMHYYKSLDHYRGCEGKERNIYKFW